MRETTDDIIDIGTNKEIGSLNDDILQGDSLGTNLSLVETPINSDIIELNLPHKTGSKLTNVSTMSQKPLKMVSGTNLSLTPTDIRIISIEVTRESSLLSNISVSFYCLVRKQ